MFPRHAHHVLPDVDDVFVLEAQQDTNLPEGPLQQKVIDNQGTMQPNYLFV
jgi:hypothetical protein